MFSSFIENPTNITFEGQDPGEKILFLVRAHLITNLKWIIPVVILFFLPFFLPSFIAFLGMNFPILPDTYLITFLIINYLLVLVITYEGFLGWFYNVNILTTKRVIDIDFESILFKNIDLAPLDDVQEANSTTGGLLGTIFNFGNVFVQTAAAKVEVDFENVPHPDKIADMIIDESEKIKGGP